MEEAAQVTGSQRRLVPDTLFSSTRPPHAPPAVPVTCCAAVTRARLPSPSCSSSGGSQSATARATTGRGWGAVAETAPVRSQHAPFRCYARQLALLSNSPAANRPSLPLPISGPEDFLLPSRGWRSPERQKATILYPRRLRLFSCFW